MGRGGPEPSRARREATSVCMVALGERRFTPWLCDTLMCGPFLRARLAKPVDSSSTVVCVLKPRRSRATRGCSGLDNSEESRVHLLAAPCAHMLTTRQSTRSHSPSSLSLRTLLSESLGRPVCFIRAVMLPLEGPPSLRSLVTACLNGKQSPYRSAHTARHFTQLCTTVSHSTQCPLRQPGPIHPDPP
jgi:hypothetical protein